MTKQDILDYFNDINQAYNDSSRLDSLSNMIDEMLETALEERPQGECIPVKDLINYIHTCREELFEKIKDYHQKEFEIRDSMLTNFEQIVKLASSKYKADMRGGRE